MARNRVHLDWSAGENLDVEAQPAGRASDTTIWHDEDEHLGRLGRTLPLILALLTALTCAASGPFSLRHWQEASALRGIQQTIAMKAAALSQRDGLLLNRLVDPAIAPNQRAQVAQGGQLYPPASAPLLWAEIEDVRVMGNMALVRQRVTPLSSTPQTPSYVQHLLFRNLDGRWLYTRPDAAFWGARQTLATDHMRFEFGELDRSVVLATARRIDAAYVAIFALLGTLPPASPMRIAVMPYPPSTKSALASQRTVSSPLTAEGITAASTEDTFVILVMMDLIPPIVNQLHDPSRWTAGAPWNAVSGGLQSWLMQEVTEQPHPWQRFTKPELQRVLQTEFPLQLADLSSPVGIGNSDEWLWRQGAAEQLLAYTEREFGRDKLSALVQNLAQYNTWDIVIPTVLEQSVVEFEAGWNQYLREK